jgi:type I restriction enzyme S subunit
MCSNKQGVVPPSSVPENIKVTIYSPDDILLSNIRPYFRKLWLSDRNGGCSNDVLCIRSKSKIFKYFVYYTIRQDEFFDYVMLGSKGSKMPRGDKHHIMNWPIQKPPKQMLELFNEFVLRSIGKMQNNNRQILCLEKQRNTLLPKLMSNTNV